MSPRPLSDSELIEAVKARADAGGNVCAAARALGISENACRNRLAHAAQRGLCGTAPVLPGYAIKSVSTQLGADGALEREWVRQAKEPGEAFEVPAGHVVAGISAYTDAEGRVIGQWTKTKAVSESATPLIEAVRAVLAGYEGPAPLLPAPLTADSDLLTVYPLPDLHLGMHSWGVETGEDYDLRIATTRARDMVGDLIAQSRPSRNALILGLGDWFHSNDQKAMTPRSGHLLDVDGRWPKVLAAGVRLAMDMIELAAQKHDHVTVRFVPGNHDPDATVALTVALSVFYGGNPRITVDDSPSLVFYHRFGSVLLGAVHGHTMKPDRMAMMLATDRPEDWGATKHKHLMFGHIHHETVKEIGPVRVESFNTIAAKDAHAHGGGYRSGQALNAITYHRERGEIGRHRVSLAA